jgi:hypothetical protein
LKDAFSSAARSAAAFLGQAMINVSLFATETPVSFCQTLCALCVCNFALQQAWEKVKILIVAEHLEFHCCETLLLVDLGYTIPGFDHRIDGYVLACKYSSSAKNQT